MLEAVVQGSLYAADVLHLGGPNDLSQFALVNIMWPHHHTACDLYVQIFCSALASDGFRRALGSAWPVLVQAAHRHARHSFALTMVFPSLLSSTSSRLPCIAAPPVSHTRVATCTRRARPLVTGLMARLSRNRTTRCPWDT